MNKPDETYTILMVDDDAEDCMLFRDALRETSRPYDLRFVRDGEELFDYLLSRGEYEDNGAAPVPDLILLDLKMPRRNGRETLKSLKTHDKFKRIPVVVLTTSTADDDIFYCYDMCANSYMTKPNSFSGLVSLINALSTYWFQLAQLPPKEQ